MTTESGRVLHYGYLVLASGIQLDFSRLPGLAETLGQRGVSSNYRYLLKRYGLPALYWHGTLKGRA